MLGRLFSSLTKRKSGLNIERYKSSKFDVFLLEDGVDIDVIDSLEKYYISKYGGVGELHNKTRGGSGVKNRRNSLWKDATEIYELQFPKYREEKIRRATKRIREIETSHKQDLI